MRPTSLIALLLACSGPAALAEPVDPYFTDPALAPYPPGCITLPARQVDLYGDNVVQFWSGKLSLEVVHKLQNGTNHGSVEAGMYRVGCAEPNRSVIVMEFRLPAEWVDPRLSQLVLPSFSAEGPGGFHYIPFELKLDPNTWGQSGAQQSLTMRAFGDFSNGWMDPRWFTWRYVLDMAPAEAGWPLMADHYNEAFQLHMVSNGRVDSDISIPVPATRDLLKRNPALPLNGRLTGAWIEPGASDQGLVLSFSELVPPAGTPTPSSWRPELNLFLSWFTFDTEGRQLWLAGNVRFQPGASEVTLPLVEVEVGEFLGAPAADSQDAGARRSAGQARLRALSCDELELEYEFVDPGLGAGTMQLHRPFALETAGYPCRDYAARLASRSASSTETHGE